MLIELQNEYLQLVLKTLLQDKNTGKNIIWATNDYIKYGPEYESNCEMTSYNVNCVSLEDLQPRVSKSKEVQKGRTKGKAEVFTPSWICNFMNTHCDTDWFDTNKKDTNGNIQFMFDKKKTLKGYVDLKKLEITCGEAPFVVSRYDTTTGNLIPLYKRIGFLDRKLMVISQAIKDKEEWVKMVYRAYESSYGYEYQGDNLLKARINLFYTFIDYYEKKWNDFPKIVELKKIANIISRNFWQMDGLTYLALSEPIKCKVYNWRNKKNMNIIGEDSMKFDYVIGNPPYQKNTGETANRQEPIYHFFMDSAYEIGEKVELITPARFLFNAGQTPVEWNKKMLNDENLKVLSYTANSKEVFPENDIKGGVAITYRDSTRNFGAIRTFIAYTELRTIRDKVRDIETEFISDYVIGQSNFNLDNLYKDYPNFKDRIHSGGRSKQIRSNAFEKFPEIFKDEESSKEMLKFYGIEKHNRTYKYIESKYIEPLANQDFYKVLIPQANGSGAIGEVLSTPVMGTPVMGTPVMGYTQSFIGLGVFKEEKECLNCLKYVKTKFARAMLGTLKITQNNAAPVIWSNVPMQDFTENSDIDWSVSISEIDKQLYKKYGLDEKEIAFIEEKVKEME